MVGAVQALAKIRRKDCVFHARTHFTLERMIQNYEALYASILHTERSVNQLLPQFKSQAMVFPGLH
jgi:hypothetical protein